jgi:glutaconyl-CoA/methylmalonyl-CoA decarboxylase subunit gamma
MIKRLRVTVDGVSYDVSVELPDDAGASAAAHASTAAVPAAPPVIASASAPTPALPVAAAAPAEAAVPAGPDDVPSPLTGRVTAVVVSTGQAVKEGDHLITLEAMKMNTFVFAPKSGSVAEVKVVVGDAVEENQILARIQ